MDIDTTIAEMNGYQLRRHRIIIERLCPIYQERKRNQMEDKNRLNSDTVAMLRADLYEIRLMQIYMMRRLGEPKKQDWE